MRQPLVLSIPNLSLKRVLIITVLALVLAASSYIVFELVTTPIDIDVSDCKTKWKDDRIVSVTCPGGRPG